MSKFEPKITPYNGSDADLNVWCLRNVEDNLRRFKAEFLRRLNSAEMLTSQEIVMDMLPDDPPKATGDDARDAARWRYVKTRGIPWSEFFVPGRNVTFTEAIDAAMAREAAK